MAGKSVTRKYALTAGVLLTAALAVAGCREEEQGRPLEFDKGSYAGKADAPIDTETREVLRKRVLNQGL